jgi:hypothetical protein
MTDQITLRFRERPGGRQQRSVRINPRWAGQGLAVHKPVIIDGNHEPVFMDRCPGVWALSHVPSGYSAGRFYGSLTKAIRFARQWDARIAVVTTNKLPADLKREYLEALAVGSAGPSREDLIEAGV